MNKKNVLIAVGALVVFAFLIKNQKKADKPKLVYASNQYSPIWESLPQDTYLYV